MSDFLVDALREIVQTGEVRSAAIARDALALFKRQRDLLRIFRREMNKKRKART